MILINLCGGPGCGKTTLAYYLAYALKRKGVLAELVMEAARESHIYDSTPGVVPPPLKNNQFLVAGQQYERILRLKRHGIAVAISDSPLIQGLMYTEANYKKDLAKIISKVEKEFETYNILVKRIPGTYIAESRVQKTEEEAAKFDEYAKNLLLDIWEEGSSDDGAYLALKIYNLIKKG